MTRPKMSAKWIALLGVAACACVAPAPTKPTPPARTSPAPVALPRPASTALPPGRFSLNAPLSVDVREDSEKEGQRERISFRLDVCPGNPDGYVVRHRDMRVTHFNGVPVDGTTVSPQELRRMEFGLSALPAMMIDRTGAFMQVTGVDQMLEQLIKTYPEQNLERLRAPTFKTILQGAVAGEMAMRWNAWVGIWARYDGQRGGPQNLMVPPMAGPLTVTRSDARNAVPGAIRLEGRHLFSIAELHAAARTLNPAIADTGLDLQDMVHRGELLFDVETSWPEIRPRLAHSRSMTHATIEGQEVDIVEDHVYRFDWEHVSSDAQCTTPRDGSP